MKGGNTKEIDLEQLKLVAMGQIGKKLMDDCMISEHGVEMEIGEHLFFHKDCYVVRLTKKIWAHKEGIYEFEWYASWWQELRERLLPGWWLRKYPSNKEIKKRLQVVSLYPSLWIDEKEHKAVINFQVWSENEQE